jgi:hypothetical protein
MIFLRRFGATISVMLACACSKPSDSHKPAPEVVTPAAVGAEGTIGSYKYTVVASSGLNLGEGLAGESGTIRFENQLPQVATTLDFSLSAKVREGGGLSLILLSNFELSTGLRLGLLRRGNEVFSVMNGVTADQALGGIDAAQPIALRFRLTADGKHAKVLMFDQRGSTEEPLFESAAWELTEAEVSNRYWGLSLVGSEVSSLDLEDQSNLERETPQDFSVADLHATGLKAIKRFERLAIPHSSILRYKTWKTATYTWVTLTYSINEPGAAAREDQIYLACHFHGKVLGCHKKNEGGPQEPAEPLEENMELPGIEDEPLSSMRLGE